MLVTFRAEHGPRRAHAWLIFDVGRTIFMCQPSQQANVPQERKPAYIFYCAPIIHPASTKLKTLLGNAQNMGHTHVTLLMASEGGLAQEGFALHAFISALSLEITVCNLSHVDSIAIAPFLACSRRIAHPRSSFLIHDFYYGQPQPVMAPSQIHDHSLMFATWRGKLTSLLKTHSNLTDSRFDELQLFEKPKVLDAASALKEGLVESIEEIHVPFGAEVCNIEY